MKISTLQKGLIAQYKLDSNSKSVSGAELVTNGSFDVNTNNWTLANTAVLASVAGGFLNNCLQITNGAAAFGYAYSDALTTVAGQTYQITFYHKSGTSGAARLAIGTSSSGAELYDTGSTLNDTNWTRYTATFTATTTTSYIRLINGTSTINQTTFFDEITVKAVSVLDSTPYSNNGANFGGTTIGGATDNHGQSGRATTFDGVNDYINCGVITAYPSMSIFIRVKGDLNKDKNIISKYNSTGAQRSWMIWPGTGTGSTMRVIISDDGTRIGHTKDYTSSLTIMDNTWHTIGFTFSAGTLKLFVDGVEDPSPTKTTDDAIVTIFNSNQPILIGWNQESGFGYFTGSMSDARIYNRALSQTEIIQLYNSYRPQITQSNLQKGLVFHQTLDSITKLKDKTPYSNSSTSANVTVGDSADRHGQLSMATAFNGSTSEVDVVSSASLESPTSNIAVSIWFKKTGAGTGVTPGIISKRTSSWGLIWVLAASNALSSRIYQSDGTAINPTPITILDDVWYHFVLTASTVDNKVRTYLNGIEQGTGTSYDGTVRAGNDALIIGQQSASFFQGVIGDIRIYNRQFTATDVTQLYNSYRPKLAQSSLQKGLIFNQSLDSITGIKDKTPNLNNGTAQGGITIGGATDRHGQANRATAFAGTDDYISLANTFPGITPSATYTMTGWIMKTDSSSSVVMNISTASANRHGVFFTGNKLGCAYYNGTSYTYATSTNNITLDVWHQFVCINNAGTLSLYVDGAVQTTTAVGLGLGSGQNYIGYNSNAGVYFIGSMSDIRIYDRVLTATEITSLYNNY